MVNHNLFDYYKTNNWLFDHGYTIPVLEDMSPFEREIYIKLLMTKLEKKANETQ